MAVYRMLCRVPNQDLLQYKLPVFQLPHKAPRENVTAMRLASTRIRHKTSWKEGRARESHLARAAVVANALICLAVVFRIETTAWPLPAWTAALMLLVAIAALTIATIIYMRRKTWFRIASISLALVAYALFIAGFIVSAELCIEFGYVSALSGVVTALLSALVDA